MATVETKEVISLKTDKDGAIRIGNTRVTLDTFVAAFNEGATAEEIAYQYPVLSLADIYSVIGFRLFSFSAGRTNLLRDSRLHFHCPQK